MKKGDLPLPTYLGPILVDVLKYLTDLHAWD